ncbi:MAG TPA: MerR family transcriptional regulator [Firmicutes bacterium]|jgi:DNA-binding transcriptional MerR regulator|nr:MerR family transcriptional regulator [Bacillota bacterium]HAZ22022.1 MerR family transcriptional regulator [Bacillota bacterium]HCM17292.1 MerR family transcriptional regulator [Bacillota bacterium]HCX72013.1 MerR family transcriptional regulator [Bacillota bacterium]
MNGLIKIRDVSTKYDISARTLRYYEDMGLITSTRSDDYAYRLYDETAVQRLEQILILRKLNISIKDIQRIFNTSGSEVVLEVLSKKVDDIDGEVSLLHELKEIVLEFIRQIENADFGKESDIKLLYEKAKEIETRLVNVDYEGNTANVNRLLAAAEKVEKQPDILLVEMPPCRMVTSGYLSVESDDEHRRFDSMCGRLASRIADKINPRDFMYYDAEQNKLVWMFMLEDWMTESDTEGFKIINFDGGLFAAALADGWELSEYDRVYKGINAWLTQQEFLELDKAPDRHMLYHFAGPHSAQMKKWNYGRVRYFVPIKAKGGK